MRGTLREILAALAWAALAGAAQAQAAPAASPPSAAPPPAAEARWTPGVYTLGQEIPLEVTLPVDSADFFLTGLPPDGGDWGPARLRGTRQEKPASFPGTLRLTLTVQLFGVGEVGLPPLLLSVNTASGARTFAVGPPPVKIQGSLPEGAGPPPPAQALPFPEPGPWRWAIPALLALAAAGAGLAWYLRRRRLRAATLPPAPQVLDPDAWIRAEVARLLASPGDAAPRYAALSKCLRDYLQIKTGKPFPDWTTSEIRRALRDLPRLSGDEGRELAWVLALCDQVKFAKYRPAPEEEGQIGPRVHGALEALLRPVPETPEEAA